MKKYYTLLGIFLITLLLYLLYGKFYIGSNSDLISNSGTLNTITVEKKGFTSNLEINGVTKIKNEQKIRFNTIGNVTKVHFEIGDYVKEGEKIAEIDSSEILNEIEKTESIIKNSKVKLENFLNSLNKSGIKNAELELALGNNKIIATDIEYKFLLSKQKNELAKQKILLDESKNLYNILIEEYKKNISVLNLTDEDKAKILKEKELELGKLTIDYNNFKDKFSYKLEQKINDFYSKIESSFYGLQTTIINGEKNLKDISYLLGLDEENKFEFGDYFGAKNSSYKSKSQSSFYETKTIFEKLNKSIQNINGKNDIDNILKSLILSKDFNNSLYSTSDYLVKGFENSIETSGFSKLEINSYSTFYNGLRIQSINESQDLITKIDEFKNYDSVEKIKQDLVEKLELQLNNIEKLKLEIEKINSNQSFLSNTVTFNIYNEKIKLDKSKNNLDLQILEYNNLIKKQGIELLDFKLNSEKNKLNIFELENKKNELINLNKNEEYISLTNDIIQNEVNSKDLYKKLENYILIAPFNGKISNIDIKEGDRLNADTQKYITITDPDLIEIETFVNQGDIIKLEKGLKTEIYIDAYNDEIFTGSIVEIDSTPTDINGIQKFKVNVSLKNPKKLKIYSGIKAIVKISLDTIPIGIAVPYASVMSDLDGKKYVTIILNDGKKVKRYIEVGYTDGEYYQVIDGITEGDKILEIDFDSESFQMEDNNIIN